MRKSAVLLVSLLTLTFLFLCLSQLRADTPAAPAPSIAEVVRVGLQMVRSRAALDDPAAPPGTFEANIPVSVADVLAGTRNLAALAPATQNYVQNTFRKYATSSQSFSYEDEKVLRIAAKTSLGSLVQERLVRFKLRPFMEILPTTLSMPGADGKVGMVGYGQSINLDNPEFAMFLTSLTAVQKRRITHGGGLKLREFNDKQKAFISHLWQSSSQPDCAKYCSLPDTDVQVRCYLEADITQIYATGSVTYLLELPLPGPNQTSFGFDSPIQGQVWMLY